MPTKVDLAAAFGKTLPDVIARAIESRSIRAASLPSVRAARAAEAPGLQDETIGDTRIWILPNPSGLNANYRPDELVALYRELKEWIT
jgi:TDG/mug DNA glycosylase family protein